MAKRQTTKRFSITSFDNAHYKSTESYVRAVDALFDAATKDITSNATKCKVDNASTFKFDDYPRFKKQMQKTVDELASKMITTIETGSRKQWLYACDKNDAFINSIMDTSKLKKSTLSKMQDRNLDALDTFQKRKVDGMNLSSRVWRYVDQYKDQMEQALDVGLGEGRSAQQLARDVKQNLKDPNRLFRRVRDKRGNLVLSKNAKAFHPGAGVYRSSVKNAQRLTRSEINMAYRESDYRRWQLLDFVVGFEILRSNHKPLCKCKMCEQLKGKYPKDFEFKGWHPQCMCYAVPIMADDKTINDNESDELKAALRGTSYTRRESPNKINDVPQGFKDWVNANMSKQKTWKSTPYFVKDNFKNGRLADGLKFAVGQQVQTKSLSNALAQQESLERTRDYTALETAWGIKRGTVMSFDDANKNRGNPNYVENQYIADPNGKYYERQSGKRLSKNPDWKRQYTVNCQTCVVANEMRRRGFDVEAKGKTRNSMAETLSHHTEMAWVDAQGNTPTSTHVHPVINNAKSSVIALENEMKDVGRYHVKWKWTRCNSGHIITCEKLADGTFRYYDPQNGKIIDDFAEYAETKHIALSGYDYGFKVLRVDNLMPDDRVVKEILIKFKKTRKLK